MQIVEYANRKRELAIEKYRESIREKAIEKVKSRLILAGKKAEELDEESLEHLVKEEEDIIISKMKGSAGVAILALFGIGGLGL